MSDKSDKKFIVDDSLLGAVKFDAAGLVPVIVQDFTTAEVLMTAWANEEALRLTIERGEMIFWSRSRSELWHKGETSGSTMQLVELRIDCDGDTLLALVRPAGPACHTGERTCFYRSIARTDGVAHDTGTFLASLFRYLEVRAHDDPKESYTASLIARGRSRVAQKIGEEGVETALAHATGDRDGFRYEAADLIYHTMVACVDGGVPFAEIVEELESRHKPAR